MCSGKQGRDHKSGGYPTFVDIGELPQRAHCPAGDVHTEMSEHVMFLLLSQYLYQVHVYFVHIQARRALRNLEFHSMGK